MKWEKSCNFCDNDEMSWMKMIDLKRDESNCNCINGGELNNDMNFSIEMGNI